MRYEILGPVGVVDGTGSARLNAPRLVSVLAVLLIRSDHVVTVDQLTTEIWGETPPQRADAGIHVCVSRLRKFLCRPGQPVKPIVSTRGGYQLVRDAADELDAETFQDLVARGRRSTRDGHYANAVTGLESALSLWRGPVFGGATAGPIVGGFVKRIELARMECIDMLVGAKLELGHHQELIGWLRDLTTEFPLREEFYRQLMVALIHSGLQAEALQTYEAACLALDRELGIGPAPQLTELYRTCLAGVPF